MARLKLVDQTPALFSPSGEEDVPDRLWARLRRTIRIGYIVVAVFFVVLLIWAAFSPLTSAVSAPGVIKVENNRKTIKRLEPGIIRQILVHEGDHVKAGQLLMVFDDSQPKAQLSEVQNAYDAAEAERARFEAEAAGKSSITFPADLLSRRSDPLVAAIIASQQGLFDARLDLLHSQQQIGRQREKELGEQINGLRAQVASTDAQLRLNKDELAGVQSLYANGYAPKTRLLALQRSAASLGGDRGDQTASIARVQQNIGETRMQTLQEEQTRISEAATGLQQADSKLADYGPRLSAAKDLLSHTRVYAPVSGTVLNLTQFTEGGVAGANEPLMDIVPTGEPLVIEAQIQPKDAHAVQPGQKANLTLIAYNTRSTPRITATVSTISADATVDPHSGKPFFMAQLKIPPEELKKLPAEVKIYPGMPVSASIVNGQKTILSYIVSPFTDVMHASMHE
jgi:HlyD family type I secretion membrane fusion protein